MKTRLAVVLALLALAYSSASATVIFDNLIRTSGGSMSVSSYFIQSQSFRGGVEDSFLSQVSLNLRNDYGSTRPFVVELYDNAGSKPGNLLGTLDGPANPGTGVFTYSATNSITLQGGLTYWIGAKTVGGYYVEDFYTWLFGNDVPEVGNSRGRAIGNNALAEWELGPNNLGLKVEVTPIPEPSGISQIILGLAATILFGRLGRR